MDMVCGMNFLGFVCMCYYQLDIGLKLKFGLLIGLITINIMTQLDHVVNEEICSSFIKFKYV